MKQFLILDRKKISKIQFQEMALSDLTSVYQRPIMKQDLTASLVIEFVNINHENRTVHERINDN